jgi:hypothetical protein
MHFHDEASRCLGENEPRTLGKKERAPARGPNVKIDGPRRHPVTGDGTIRKFTRHRTEGHMMPKDAATHGRFPDQASDSLVNQRLRIESETEIALSRHCGIGEELMVDVDLARIGNSGVGGGRRAGGLATAQ